MALTHTNDYQRADGRVARLTFAEPDGATRGGWLTEHGVDADLMGVVGFDLGGMAALVVASHRNAEVVTNVVRYPGANHRFDADPGAAAELGSERWPGSTPICGSGR